MLSLFHLIQFGLSKWHDILVCGDFNVNLLKNSSSSSLFHEFCQDLNLHLVIDTSTSITEATASLIDIILTSNRTKLKCAGTLPLSGSDHQRVYVAFTPRIKRAITKTPTALQKYTKIPTFKSSKKNYTLYLGKLWRVLTALKTKSTLGTI